MGAPSYATFVLLGGGVEGTGGPPVLDTAGLLRGP